MDGAQYARAMDEHERLKRLYAKAVSRLFSIGYQVTDSEYRQLKTFTEDVRIDLEIARQEVEKTAANATVAEFAGPLGMDSIGAESRPDTSAKKR